MVSVLQELRKRKEHVGWNGEEKPFLLREVGFELCFEENVLV